MPNTTQIFSAPKGENEKLDLLREKLKEAGLDYVITRSDDAVAHINVWIGKD